MFVPGLAETGSHQFTIGVEDGRGGFDEQSFTLDILPELRGSIRGQAFDDLDSSGSRNGSEPVLPGVHLFIDANGTAILTQANRKPQRMPAVTTSSMVFYLVSMQYEYPQWQALSHQHLAMSR